MELVKNLMVIVMGTLLMSTPTTGPPVRKPVLIQCGNFECDIRTEYCYFRQRCVPCNKATCNTYNYDEGNLLQCSFYCETLDEPTTPTNSTCANNISGVGVWIGVPNLLLIVFGSFAFGAFTLWLLYKCRDIKWRDLINKNTKKKRAFPISNPQGKHSGNSDPSANCKMLISNTENSAML